MALIHKKDGFNNEKIFVLPHKCIVNYCQHPLVKKLFLTDVGFFQAAKYHYRERQEGADEFILLYCIEGKGNIALGNRQFNLSQNQLFCIPAHTGHLYYADQDSPWSILWLHFKGGDTAFYPLQHPEMIEIDTPKMSERLQSHFLHIFERLEKEYTQDSIIYCSQIVSALLAEIYFRPTEPTLDQPGQLIANISKYMRANLGNNLTLDDFAAHAQISKSPLSNLFKKHTGKSPIDYYIHLKIQTACNYFKITNMKVYEVAKELGYDDQYYFSRIFKKHIGLSPVAYKASVTAK